MPAGRKEATQAKVSKKKGSSHAVSIHIKAVRKAKELSPEHGGMSEIQRIVSSNHIMKDKRA